MDLNIYISILFRAIWLCVPFILSSLTSYSGHIVVTSQMHFLTEV